MRPLGGECRIAFSTRLSSSCSSRSGSIAAFSGRSEISVSIVHSRCSTITFARSTAVRATSVTSPGERLSCCSVSPARSRTRVSRSALRRPSRCDSSAIPRSRSRPAGLTSPSRSRISALERITDAGVRSSCEALATIPRSRFAAAAIGASTRRVTNTATSSAAASPSPPKISSVVSRLACCASAISSRPAT